MEEYYHVIWTGDEAGLYRGEQLVAGAWSLRRRGYELWRILGWSQAALARVAREVEAWLRS